MLEIDTLRAVFDDSREPVLLLKDGIVEYENPAAAELLPGGMTGALRAALEAGESGPLLLEGRLVCPRTVERAGSLLVVLRAADDGLEGRMPLLLEDLRSQLNNLMAAVQLMGPALSTERRSDSGDYMAILNQSLYRLLRLAQNAQLAQEMAAGQVAFYPGALDLAGLCREVCRQVEGLARMAERSFHYESGADSLITTGDEVLLRRLLLELVGNALRAAGPGGEAGVRLAVSGPQAVLTVWDNGPGADLGTMERPTSVPGPEGGLRLGLPAARYIAALHGGAMVVDSREGEGTRVAVSLPIRRPEPGSVHTPMGDPTGGFSPVLVALSGVLPFSAYRREDLEN